MKSEPEDGAAKAPLSSSYALNKGPRGWSQIPLNKPFLVRSNSFLNDRVKCLSAEPLFELLGVQMIRVDKLQRDVALQPWCSFPKDNPQDHEWLILNFMIPATFNIQIVCLFVASMETKKVIRESSGSGGPASSSSANVTRLITNFGEIGLTVQKPSDAGMEAETSVSDSGDGSGSPSSDYGEQTEDQEREGGGGVLMPQDAAAAAAAALESAADGDNEAAGLAEGKRPADDGDREPTGVKTPPSPTAAAEHKSALSSGSAVGAGAGSEGTRTGTGAGAGEPGAESWKNSVRRFWRAEKGYCDSRFKLLQTVIDGPWLVKSAIGGKPALIGDKKLELKYSRGRGYFEVDIDISSSPMASGILRLVQGASKKLVIDLGVTIQGNRDDELPERVLCQARFSNVDFDQAARLVPSTA